MNSFEPIFHLPSNTQGSRFKPEADIRLPNVLI
jgi:hypothetical protein